MISNTPSSILVDEFLREVSSNVWSIHSTRLLSLFIVTSITRSSKILDVYNKLSDNKKEKVITRLNSHIESVLKAETSLDYKISLCVLKSFILSKIQSLPYIGSALKKLKIDEF